MSLLLRLEHGSLLVLALVGYQLHGGGWWLFAALFLVPDLSMAGYLGGPRIGAAAYNIAHAWIGPVALIAAGLVMAKDMAVTLGLVWAAHIAFDRMLGYGLKHFSGFGDTHLGPVGRRRAAVAQKNR